MMLVSMMVMLESTEEKLDCTMDWLVNKFVHLQDYILDWLESMLD